MDRIVIIGTSCSGKTTLAGSLAKILDYPHIHLDALHWLENWQARPTDELRKIVKEKTANPNWVLDGNYSKLQPITWSRATTLIWLNYTFPVVFGRALSRTFKRALFRDELFSGNRESFSRAFLSKNSILLWVLKTYFRRRKKYRYIFDNNLFPELQKIELKSPKEIREFVLLIKSTRVQLSHGMRPTVLP